MAVFRSRGLIGHRRAQGALNVDCVRAPRFVFVFTFGTVSPGYFIRKKGNTTHTLILRGISSSWLLTSKITWETQFQA